jgi:anti-anti-sigma factor
VSAFAQLTETEHEGVVTAAVQGEIDASNCGWIGDRLRGMVSNHSVALEVDLRRVSYIDSAGIALLFRLADELRTRRQALRVTAQDGSGVSRMLALTGLHQALDRP